MVIRPQSHIDLHVHIMLLASARQQVSVPVQTQGKNQCVTQPLPFFFNTIFIHLFMLVTFYRLQSLETVCQKSDLVNSIHHHKMNTKSACQGMCLVSYPGTIYRQLNSSTPQSWQVRQHQILSWHWNIFSCPLPIFFLCPSFCD